MLTITFLAVLTISTIFVITGLYTVRIRNTLRLIRNMYSAIPGRVIVVNSQEKILYFNEENKQDELYIGKRYIRDIPNIDYEKISAAVREVFASGKKKSIDYRVNDVERSITIAKIPAEIFGEETVIWFSHDNSELQTARRQAEDFAIKLKDSVRLWDLLINSLPIHIFAKNPDDGFKYVFCNKHMANFYDLPQEKIVGQTDADLFDEETFGEIRSLDEKIAESEDGIREQNVTATNSLEQNRSFKCLKRIFHDANGKRLILGAAFDITDSERDKNIIRDNSSMFATFIENVPCYVVAKDINDNLRYTTCNREFSKVVGRPKENIVGHFDGEFFANKNELETFSKFDREAIAKNAPTEHIMKFTSADGILRISHAHWVPIKLSGGRHWLFIFVDDITQLEESKRKVEENAEWLALTLNSIGDGVLTTDTDGRVIMVNPVAARMMGYAPENIVGKPHSEVFRIVSHGDENPAPSPLTRALRTGTVVELANHTDLVSSDGKHYPISDSAAPIFGKNGNILGAILVFHDVSEIYMQRDKLRETISQLENGCELTNSASFSYDSTSNSVKGSRLFSALWPMNENGEPLKSIDWVCPEDFERTNGQWEKIKSGKSDEETLEFRAINKGELRNYRMKVNVAKREGSKFKTVGTIQDVTDITQGIIKLHTQQKLWDLIINNIPVMIFAKNIDNDFRYVITNREFEKFVGKSKEEIAGKTDSDIFSRKEDSVWFKKWDGKISDTGRRQIFEPIQNASGEIRELRTTKIRFESPDGQKLLIGTSVDITELNSLINDQTLLSYCLQTLLSENDFKSAAARILGAVCKHFQSNRSFIFKFDTARSTLSNFAEYVADGGEPVFAKTGGQPITSKPDWSVVLKDNPRIMIRDIREVNSNLYGKTWKNIIMKTHMRSLYVNRIVLDGKIWGYAALSFENEIRDMNKSEQELFASIVHFLEIMLERHRSQDIMSEALKKAKTADKAKSFFIASVSHEIRTPLNAVIGFTELLKDDSLDTQTRNEYLDSVLYSGNVLLQLINDVLDLSKLEADSMDIICEPTDFAELSSDVKRVFELKAMEKNLRLNLQISDIPTLQLDKLRIRQILFNLFGNAVKFTVEGSVTLWAKFETADGISGTLSFGVTDTGIGISDEDKAKILEPFVQLSKMRGTNAANNGTGLGLSICKRLAEKMGGKMWIESELGRGSTFGVVLYNIVCSKDADAETKSEKMRDEFHSAAAISEVNTARKAVLIVDDVDMNLKILRALCAKAGIKKIDTASSGFEALEKMKASEYDTVLTDIWMPAMNGAELAQKIRNIYGNKIFVAALTADVEASKNFETSAFDKILQKPITVEKICSLVLDS